MSHQVEFGAKPAAVFMDLVSPGSPYFVVSTSDFKLKLFAYLPSQTVKNAPPSSTDVGQAPTIAYTLLPPVLTCVRVCTTPANGGYIRKLCALPRHPENPSSYVAYSAKNKVAVYFTLLCINR